MSEGWMSRDGTMYFPPNIVDQILAAAEAEALAGFIERSRENVLAMLDMYPVPVLPDKPRGWTEPDVQPATLARCWSLTR